MARYAFNVVPAIMLIAALASWPYGYYTFLRLVVCACAALIAFKEYQYEGSQGSMWMIGFGGIALLFNPLIPVHLTRDIWAVIDVAVALVFGGHAFVIYKRSPQQGLN